MSRYVFPKGKNPTQNIPEVKKLNKNSPTDSRNNSAVSPEYVTSEQNNPTLRKKLNISSEETHFGNIRVPNQPKDARSLSIAMIGAPNAGKSTLANALVGTKVAIVSSRAQTTREETIGVITQGNVQLVFNDTPGIVPEKDIKMIQHSIVAAAWRTVSTADLVLLIVDAARKIDQEMENIVRRLEDHNKKEPKDAILVLNKIDLAKGTVMPLAERFLATKLFKEHFLVSALHGTGIDDLKDYLMYKAVPNDWSFHSETKTDWNEQHTAAEIIREKLFHKLYQELPYLVQQENVGWNVLPNGDIRIDQVLYVPKESQKRILIGKNGSVLNFIQTAARSEMSRRFNKNVHLFLHVKKRDKGGDEGE